jgi:hypothetical protein
MRESRDGLLALGGDCRQQGDACVPVIAPKQRLVAGTFAGREAFSRLAQHPLSIRSVLEIGT